MQNKIKQKTINCSYDTNKLKITCIVVKFLKSKLTPFQESPATAQKLYVC